MTTPHTTSADIAEAVCQAVAELGDRNSPADWPEAMLVTGDELHLIVTEALAASAPVAPTLETEAVRWEFRWLNPANSPYSSPSEMAWKLVEPKSMQPLEAALSDLRACRYAGKPCYEVRPLFAQAAPVAPAPQPAPPTEKTLEKLRKWEQNGELIERAWKVLNDQENEIIRLERELAATPKAGHIPEAGKEVAPLQQGEYPATGNPEADRVLGRLNSSDPGFDDCAEAAALIYKLVSEIKGPDGFATWKDAAIAARGQALRLLTQKEKDSLGRRAEGMDGNEWDQWVQEKFAQVNGLRVQGGSYEWDWE